VNPSIGALPTTRRLLARRVPDDSAILRAIAVAIEARLNPVTGRVGEARVVPGVGSAARA